MSGSRRFGIKWVPVTSAPRCQHDSQIPRSVSPFIPPRPPSLNPSPLETAPLPLINFQDWKLPRPDNYDASPPFSAPLDSVGNLAGLSPSSQRRRAYNPPLRLHPLLNAEVPVNHFFFDLSSMFDPLLRSREDYAEPATYPPISRMRIIYDIFPRELEMDITVDPLPITVRDVLEGLCWSLQLQTDHNDWAQLSQVNKDNVSRAFDSRCRAAPGGHDGYLAERAKGVKRVDYLQGKTRLLGLLKVGNEDGRDTFKFVTTKPYEPLDYLLLSLCILGLAAD